MLTLEYLKERLLATMIGKEATSLNMYDLYYNCLKECFAAEGFDTNKLGCKVDRFTLYISYGKTKINLLMVEGKREKGSTHRPYGGLFGSYTDYTWKDFKLVTWDQDGCVTNNVTERYYFCQEKDSEYLRQADEDEERGYAIYKELRDRGLDDHDVTKLLAIIDSKSWKFEERYDAGN